MTIGAQIGVYPLGQAHLTPTIDAVTGALTARGLSPVVGAMSTLVSGDLDVVLDGLREAFREAATSGHVVMAVTLSNACPIPSR